MSENRGATPSAGTGGFSAADLRRRMAEREAAKAAEELRHMKEQEEKQKAVMEEFHKPPERTPEQVMQLIMRLVNRAAERLTPLPGRRRKRNRACHRQPMPACGASSGWQSRCRTVVRQRCE